MKTLIIYNGFEEDIKYAIIDGDHSDIHGAVINVYSTEKETKALDLIFDPANGDFLIELSEDISLVELKQWDKIAVVCFAP